MKKEETVYPMLHSWRNRRDIYGCGSLGDPFRDAAYRQNPLSQMDARFPSGHVESSAGRCSGYCTGSAGAGSHMDVRNEPKQHEQRYCDLMHRSCGL